MTDEDLRTLRRQAWSLGEALGIAPAKNALLRCIDELERLSNLERSLEAWVDHQQRLADHPLQPATAAGLQAHTQRLAAETLAQVAAYRNSVRERLAQVRAQE